MNAVDRASYSCSPAQLRQSLAHADYLADEALAEVLWLALRLERPLLLEGEAGVGKTAIAAAAACRPAGST